jgi:mono/diheme cytochrome c family protein
MNHINKISVWALWVAMFAGVTSCSDPASTGIEYAPEMYHSIPLEPYSQIDGADHRAPFKDGLNAQVPPDGTIPRGGHAAYALKFDVEGEKASNLITVNPLPATQENLDRGDTLFRRFCGVCHGSGLKGEKDDGPLAKHEMINPPDFNAAPYTNFSNGRFYHTIMHGKGVMGSYASQLRYEDRWKVIHHIQKILHPEWYEGLGPDAMLKPQVAVYDTVGKPKPVN